MGNRIKKHLSNVMAFFMSLSLMFNLVLGFAPTVAHADETEMEIDVAKILVSGALSGGSYGVAYWTAGKLMNSLFGDNISASVESQLDSIMQTLDQMNTAINHLQSTENSQELDGILNDLKPMLLSKTPHNVLTALEGIEGPSDDPEAKQRAQSALIEGLGNGLLGDENIATLASVDGEFDKFAENLWNAMSTPYSVTFDGQAKNLTLMQVWYEHLRYEYHWEHQSYDEWSSFQGRCVSLLAVTLALEKASLQERIELLRQWNAVPGHVKHDEGACISRLNDVQDWINQMKGYKGEVNEMVREGAEPSVKTVNYPGLFNEKTWASQYWMYKKRDESERYYWRPGHEVVFYAHVNTQDIPPEGPNAGLRASRQDNYGLVVTWLEYGTYDVTPHWQCWDTFLRYSGPDYDGGNDTLATENQLRTIYKDYNKKLHLYDIFIGKDEGNFLGLDETGIDTWYFPVDDKIFFDKDTWPQESGTMRCHVLVSANAENDTATLCNYYAHNAYRNKRRHFIGIGVKRVGPEVYGSGVSAPVEPATYDTQTNSDSALWWPGCGDLPIGYDSESQGAIKKVTMDGETVDAAQYTVADGKVVLSEKYMESLSFGRHELVLDAEHGSHTVTFWVKKAQKVTVENASFDKKVTDEPFMIVAKTDGDGKLTYTSSDENVALVAEDGSVGVKGAGGATITVWAAETKDYAPGKAEVAVNVKGDKGVLTFNLDGGSLKGQTGSVVIEANVGDVITIPDAPTRAGYVFKYWKGSEYYPGDKYTVEGDHTFTAVWASTATSTTSSSRTSSSSSSSSSSLPRTGDRNGMVALVAVLIAALAAFVWSVVLRRD